MTVRKGGKPVKGAAAGSAGAARAHGADVWEIAGAHCSANERRADEASRDVEAWLKCRYMRERLGEEFGGTVTAATSFGLFVTLDGLYVEGLVHITELGGEYFRFDEARQELRGERSGVRYTIGSRVRVQVSRVDLDGRRIDFRMVREGEPERPAGRGGREGRDSREGRDKGGERRAAASAVEELAAVQEADRSVKARTRKAAGKRSSSNGASRKSSATGKTRKRR